jgi:hypothetical protein
VIEAIYLFSLQISPEGKQVKTDNGKKRRNNQKVLADLPAVRLAAELR